MTKAQKLLYCALLAGALLLRLYHLEDWPYEVHADPGLYSWHAWRLIDGKYASVYESGAFEIPLIGHLQTAFWALLFGRSSVAAIRMPAVAASLLAIAAAGAITWQLSRRFLAVVVTMTLLAVSPVFHHYSRMPAFLDPVSAQAVAVAALLAAEQHVAWAPLAGAAGALSFLSYYPGRLTPAVLAWVGLFRWRSGHLRFRTLVLAGAVSLLMIAPQWLSLQRGWNWKGSMEQFCWWVTPTPPPPQCRLLPGTQRLLVALWTPHQDRSPHYGGGAFLDYFTLATLVVGLVYVLRRKPDKNLLMVMLWAAPILFIGGVLMIRSPFFSRFVGALVPIAVAAGLVIAHVPRARGFEAAVLVALAVTARADIRQSLREWSTQGGVQASQQYQTIVGRQILQLPAGTPVAFDDCWFDMLSCNLGPLQVFLQHHPCSMVSTTDGQEPPEGAVLFAYPDPFPKPAGWRRTSSPM